MSRAADYQTSGNRKAAFLSSEGDLDLHLLEGNGQNPIASATDGTDHEGIQEMLPGGTYYVRVDLDGAPAQEMGMAYEIKYGAF